MEIEVQNLTKRYSDKCAVDGICCRLRTGVNALLGANGAGKTTFMRMLCGVLPPTEGAILWQGRPIGGERYRESLGYLPQDLGYYPSFTGMDFLLYIAALKGIPKEKAKARSMELIRLVGLEGKEKKKLQSYSGGMKQRIGIAQAMLNQPKILILDEPTAGLDPKERVRFRNLIAQLGKSSIVLLSTHIVSDVEEIAGQILLMKDGRLIVSGTKEELEQHYRQEVSTGDTEPFHLERLYLHYFGEVEEHDSI